MKKIERMDKILYAIEESREVFQKGIAKLVKDIEDPHDDYLIEGKCEKCKSWNK